MFLEHWLSCEAGPVPVSIAASSIDHSMTGWRPIAVVDNSSHMRSTQDILLLVGRAAIGVPFIFVGLRQVEAWPDVVGLFRHAGGPYPFVLGLLTVAANLLAPMLFILGIRARSAAFVLAVITAAGLYLLHWVNVESSEFQRSVAIIGGLLLLGATGPGRYAMEPGDEESTQAIVQKG